MEEESQELLPLAPQTASWWGQGIRNSKNRTVFISTKSESWSGGSARAESAATARITRFSTAVHMAD
jgi:hypothetical protein